jgi:hypothetical protein
MNNQAKDQMVKCLIDLSERFGELDNRTAQAILLVVAGTVSEGSEDALAVWMAEYAKLRLSMIKKENKDFPKWE